MLQSVSGNGLDAGTWMKDARNHHDPAGARTMGSSRSCCPPTMPRADIKITRNESSELGNQSKSASPPTPAVRAAPLALPETTLC